MMPMGNMASAIITLTKLSGNLSSVFMMNIIIEGGWGYFYGGGYCFALAVGWARLIACGALKPAARKHARLRGVV